MDNEKGIDKTPESLHTAVAASAASPEVFKGIKYTNKDGQDELLVDGSLPASNPSLYAYLLATELYGVPKD